jgi:hypothetical protein
LEITSVENIEKNKVKQEKKSKPSTAKKIALQPAGKTKSKRKRRDSSRSSDESIDAVVSVDGSRSPQDFSDLEYLCVGCGENYKETKSADDWFECVRCRKWFHVSCSSFNDICNPCG